MKRLLYAVILATLLHQQSSAQTNPPAQGAHLPVTLGMTISLPANTSDVYGALLDIGVKNQIPLGIVLGNDRSTSLCRHQLNLNAAEKVTLSQLIAAIDANVPGYSASLNDGVLNIAPAQLAIPAARFLSLTFPEFQAPPNTYDAMGDELWKYVLGSIAPGTGWNVERLSSTETETVPGFSVKNKSVQSILNTIVNGGHGGVWIFHSSEIKDLSPQTHQAYEIRGYIGEGQYLKKLLTCAK